ncbi:hypothetical protein A2415_04480 [candidate division WWE3 bacterium RIFOXYC1_FULL_39_7]|uniref:Uncharacterized protein n=1 Tax=candidate division WWE3 bacterium RIFOXYC1_FULL_39_7 TaxID=1802643 RepID=A0A1F4WFY6_UNCKA|nr:MAG: hypothetical protein A2415_04480 [candidate division WWE3 bacterium RIFOXYC1_FULL_39_7]
MTLVKVEPERVLVNFLRTQITDPNSSRSGQWIYEDFPRVEDLGNASFPRIGVTALTESGQRMGIFDDNSLDTVSFQIDVVAKKDRLYSITVTAEALGTMVSTVNSNRFTYDFVPTTITNVQHGGVSYGTVSFVNTDANFTTPADLAAGTVEVSRSTGNLNFSSVDVAAHDTQAITSTYIYPLEGKKCAQKIAREIIKDIKNNWRTGFSDSLFNPKKIGGNPLPFDEDLGIYRYTLEYQFQTFNAGEGL